MFLIVNTNRMQPPIAPIGADYVATAVADAGHAVRTCDLCLADDPEAALRDALAADEPMLVGLSFRNSDDCFWPSGQSFLDELVELVTRLRTLTAAPLVLGGIGFSIFAERILRESGADFGIRGDGEAATVALLNELAAGRRFDRVPGLLWRDDRGDIQVNEPAWPATLAVPTSRDAFDNATYFRLGGQMGIETKRGCPRNCLYCADPVAKGHTSRLRPPADVADEAAALAARGIDMLHTCDAEFNLPSEHAKDVCREFIRRGLGKTVGWYTYLAVTPFDDELAGLMARAGCRGINFTSDSASAAMLRTYRHPHTAADIARAVSLCKTHGMTVMLDLLLGGPGETRQSVAETIQFIKKIDPTCAGAALGIRVYPGTPMAEWVAGQGPLEENPGILRHYDGAVDFFRPTFYCEPALGERPAELVKDLIAGDERFFAPADPAADYNYSDNQPLARAIAAGARGAYWHILRGLR